MGRKARIRRTKELEHCLARLTDFSRKTNESQIYRLRVIAADGKACSVDAQYAPKRDQLHPAKLNEIADRFRVRHDQIEEVLLEWDKEKLRKHLSKFPSEVLDSPAALRLWEQHV